MVGEALLRRPSELLRTVSHASLAKAASLLFELELEDEDSISYEPANSAAKRLATILAPCSTLEEKLQWDAKQAAAAVTDSSPKGLDMRAFAKALAGRGYYVWLRRGDDRNKGADQGSRCSGAEDSPRSPTASHTVVIVALAGEASGVDDLFVVDPCFKEQFALSQPPRSYEALCAALPEVLVGRAREVAAVVDLMCEEMSKVFQQDNRQSPPWRQRDYMLTKWLPQRAIDERVDAKQGVGMC